MELFWSPGAIVYGLSNISNVNSLITVLHENVRQFLDCYTFVGMYVTNKIHKGSPTNNDSTVSINVFRIHFFFQSFFFSIRLFWYPFSCNVEQKCLTKTWILWFKVCVVTECLIWYTGDCEFWGVGGSRPIRCHNFHLLHEFWQRAHWERDEWEFLRGKPVLQGHGHELRSPAPRGAGQ